MWISSFLTELGVTQQCAPVLCSNNLGATYVMANHILHDRMKHIEIDFHFVHEHVAEGAL
jgi:hypothetical protein